jgi:acetyl-CoA acyltransferase
MTAAVIVDAVRTAHGRRNGALSGWHPADLASEVLSELVGRNDVDPGLVDDVIMGCVTQVGYQSANIGRYALLAAGWPETVPATTIDRQCGSSQQAIHFAAQGVMAGVYDVVVAAGVEVMSTTPMGSSVLPGTAPFGPRATARYADRVTRGHRGLVQQGVSAELLAEEWGLTRQQLDEYGAASQQRAAETTRQGGFAREIVPVASKRLNSETGDVVERDLHSTDEGIRPDTTVDVLSQLRPAFTPDGRVTAGSSSQIADGAAAVLIMSEERAASLGLTPLARIAAMTLAGADPVAMLTAPIPATQKLLDNTKLALDDIAHIEINEAFATVVLAWAKELDANLARVNPHGGAIALGHPLGASGARLMATLVHGLTASGGRYGLQTICEGGGMANATLIERLG